MQITATIPTNKKSRTLITVLCRIDGQRPRGEVPRSFAVKSSDNERLPIPHFAVVVRHFACGKMQVICVCQIDIGPQTQRATHESVSALKHVSQCTLQILLEPRSRASIQSLNPLRRTRLVVLHLQLCLGSRDRSYSTCDLAQGSKVQVSTAYRVRQERKF